MTSSTSVRASACNSTRLPGRPSTTQRSSRARPRRDAASRRPTRCRWRRADGRVPPRHRRAGVRRRHRGTAARRSVRGGAHPRSRERRVSPAADGVVRDEVRDGTERHRRRRLRGRDPFRPVAFGGDTAEHFAGEPGLAHARRSGHDDAAAAGECRDCELALVVTADERPVAQIRGNCSGADQSSSLDQAEPESVEARRCVAFVGLRNDATTYSSTSSSRSPFIRHRARS